MGKRFIPFGKVSDRAWRQVYKAEALIAQDGKCLYCHRPIFRYIDPAGTALATAEHIVPVCRGGQTRKDNIDAACRKCNRLKGHYPKPEFQRAIKKPNLPRDGMDLYLDAMSVRIAQFTEKAVKRLTQMRL